MPTLTAVDRSGSIYQTRLADMKHDTIVNTMSPWVESDSIICSDGNDAYAKVASATGCEHIKAKVKNRNTVRGNAAGLSIGGSTLITATWKTSSTAAASVSPPAT